MLKLKLLIGLFFAGLILSTSLFAGDKKITDLQQAISGEHRTERYAARDGWRHPEQTLRFFGVKADSTVVEIWPSGGGWYSEILAPFLKQKGKFYAAQYDPDLEVKFYQMNNKKFGEKLASNADVYSAVELSGFNPKKDLDIAPEGSADFVLTFRNVHNWKGSGEKAVANAFITFYKALKAGGVLGLVEHRMPESFTPANDDRSGYVKQTYVIKMAEQAGFVLDRSSEVNANPKDTAVHPKGVWTLPPSYRMKDVDREKYQAIGESDRMTLRFIKPGK